jgi:hypothetical protein
MAMTISAIAANPRATLIAVSLTSYSGNVSAGTDGVYVRFIVPVKHPGQPQFSRKLLRRRRNGRPRNLLETARVSDVNGTKDRHPVTRIPVQVFQTPTPQRLLLDHVMAL